MEDIYPYRFSKLQVREHRARILIQYVFSVDCLNSGRQMDYFINYYKYGKFTYITDFYPDIWEKDPDCFHKLLSREEGISVNFRKITRTCFHIFHNKISAVDEDAAIVVSGSFQTGELPVEGVSRKLRLYRAILEPVARLKDYRVIAIFDYNAFVMVRNESSRSDETYRTQYVAFRKLLPPPH